MSVSLSENTWQPTAPFVASNFCGIEEMQEASESEGWTITYSQLEAGRLTAYSAARDYADLSLMDEAADRRLQLYGETPAGHMTVLAPCSGSQIWVDGRTIDSHGAVLIGASSELLCVTGKNSRVLSMHIPITLLDDAVRNLRDHRLNDMTGQRVAIEFGVVTGQRLRHAMHAAIYERIPERWQSEQTTELITRLIRLAGQSMGDMDENCHYVSPGGSVQAIARAREYVESHLKRAISMSQMSVRSAASLSKLERSFKKELDITPSGYVLARRLAAVRHELKLSSPEERQVAQVAMDYGFHHLGRFSGYYRRQFGELPSETLRAS